MGFATARMEECRKKRNGRKVVLWGAGNMLSFFNKNMPKYDLQIGYIVDMNYQIKKEKVYSPAILDKKKTDYYVIVTCEKEYPEIREILKKYGYEEGEDYSYLSVERKTNYLILPENFEDEYGNRIEGKLENTYVSFDGYNSRIVVGDNIRDNGSKIKIMSNSYLEIGDNVRLWSELFEEASRFILDHNTECVIGENSILAGGIVFMHMNSQISIGKENYYTNGYRIRTRDGHPIYDTKTGKCINSIEEKKTNIVVEDHVWLGERSEILYNTVIGSGCIVGAGSVIKGHFDSNCIIAGAPARCIKKNVTWSECYGDDFNNIPMEYRKECVE